MMKVALSILILTAYALCLHHGGTRSELKSPEMLGNFNRIKMGYIAGQTDNTPLINAYNQLDNWDNMNDAQKAKAIRKIDTKIIQPGQVGIQGGAVNAVATARQPGASSAQMDNAFRAVHQDVNKGLKTMKQNYKLNKDNTLSYRGNTLSYRGNTLRFRPNTMAYGRTLSRFRKE